MFQQQLVASEQQMPRHPTPINPPTGRQAGEGGADPPEGVSPRFSSRLEEQQGSSPRRRCVRPLTVQTRCTSRDSEVCVRRNHTFTVK